MFVGSMTFDENNCLFMSVVNVKWYYVVGCGDLFKYLRGLWRMNNGHAYMSPVISYHRERQKRQACPLGYDDYHLFSGRQAGEREVARHRLLRVVLYPSALASPTAAPATSLYLFPLDMRFRTDIARWTTRQPRSGNTPVTLYRYRATNVGSGGNLA